MTAYRKMVGLAVAGGLATGLCACGPAGTASSTVAAPAHHGTAGSTGPVPRTDAAGTVWLCRPGLAANPCVGNLDATVVPAHGARAVQHPGTPGAGRRAVDCFYVYPTVSTQRRTNATLAVTPEETGAAVAQASRFSQVCNVWAPMYRQRTAGSLAKGLGADPAADQVAYRSLLAAWQDYLDHFNQGRPVVFIGHSQGAAMLIRLLASQVDDNPALRARMVSAVIAGGNVAVPQGRLVGATFAHLPLCSRPDQTGCVIAYSSFPSEPPAGADFGRPGQGVSLQSGQVATAGVQVACVNPAAIGGGTAPLAPYFPAALSPAPPPPVTTPWVTYPGLYSAACRQGGGASWLQVDDLAGPGDHRPVVTESLGPTWGYHLDDINLALGNLVHDVAVQETAYARAHHP